jgi:hypothetical protein
MYETVEPFIGLSFENGRMWPYDTNSAMRSWPELKATAACPQDLFLVQDDFPHQW